MDRFTELALFVAVAERGSLSGAAEALGLSNPAATRYLASLESRLQVRLVERNTRRLYLTHEGQAFVERARHVLSELADAENALHGSQTEPARGVAGQRVLVVCDAVDRPTPGALPPALPAGAGAH